MGEPKKDELDKVVIKNDTLRKYFPESSTPREMEEKIIGLLEESKTEKVVFRSDSIKKYFPSNYSSEQIENSILKMLDQRMKKRKHELNADDQIKRKTHFGSFSFANMEEKAYEQHRYSYDSFRGDHH